MLLDPISERYIRIAHELEPFVEGLIDAYFGPTRPAPAGWSLARIIDEIAALRADIQESSYPASRKTFLDVHLRALDALAQRQAGHPLPYRTEVHACFDIEPPIVAESVFEEAHAALAQLLPGSGPLPERMDAWQRQFEVSPDVAQRMISRIAAEARSRTRTLVDLPDHEAVHFDLVTNKPWSGYNWYLGNAQSRVEINIDLPIRANTLLSLVCHEAYPGHHTEHARKEYFLYRERGWGEHAIQLINTPECVISEGIATLAHTIIFGEDSYEWAAREVYPLGHITGQPELERRIAAASHALRAVRGNAALLLHEQGASKTDVIAYLQRYGLTTAERAQHQYQFISHPLWRTYVYTYYVGTDMLKQWLAQGSREDRFRLLLTEQITPAQITAQTESAHA